MPRRVAIVAALTIAAYPASRLSAQLAIDVAAGARYTTTLVRDAIVTPLEVRLKLAPTVAVTLGTSSARGWGAQATLDFSTSEMQRLDVGGASTGLGRVSTAALTAGLEHRLHQGFFIRLGVGGLKYFPSEHSGIFRLGSGKIAGLGALALGHTLPVGGHYHLAVEARYDVHAFITPALQDEGFDTARLVHRVALVIRADVRGAR